MRGTDTKPAAKSQVWKERVGLQNLRQFFGNLLNPQYPTPCRAMCTRPHQKPAFHHSSWESCGRQTAQGSQC